MEKRFDKDEFEAQLKTLPTKAVLVLTIRTLLRILPLAIELNKNNIELDAENKVLPLLRSVASLRAFVKIYSDRSIFNKISIINILKNNKYLKNNTYAEILSGMETVIRPDVSEDFVVSKSVIYITKLIGVYGNNSSSEVYNNNVFDDIAKSIEESLVEDFFIIKKEDIDSREVLEDGLWAKVRMPAEISLAWLSSQKVLSSLHQDWDVWIEWYDELLSGNPNVFGFEQGILTLEEEVWDEGPVAVNPTLKSFKKQFELEMLLEELGEPDVVEEEPVDEAVMLEQRPAPHTFQERNGKLEAEAVREKPVDPEIAEELIDELRKKAQQALGGLDQNYADPRVVQTTLNFLDCIQASAEEVKEGRLLMRVRSLEAEAASFADAKAERERSIRAIMLDLATSAGDLLSLYPKLQQMEAERQALRFSSSDEHYQSFRNAVADLTEKAKVSESVGQSAVEALEEGTTEQERLDVVAETAPSQEGRAEAILKRSQIAGYQALDVRNFISGSLKWATSETGQIGRDGYDEIKKGFVKGLGKGAEGLGVTVMTGAPIALVAAVLGPLSAIAVAIPSFVSLLKNAKSLTQENAVKDDLGEESSDDDVINT